MSEILAEVWVPGRPRPKGSLKCRGGASHSMEEDNPESKPWRIKMAGALRADRDRRVRELFFAPEFRGTWRGAVDVAVFAFFEPDGVGASSLGAPLRTHDGGDVDKLSRNVLDALQDGNASSPAVLGDDSLVIGLMAEKIFTDLTAEQGIWIRVTTVGDAELIRRRRTRNAALEHLRAQLGMMSETGF
jgi:hypothetical protein